MSAPNQQVQRPNAAPKKDVRDLLQSDAVLNQIRKVLPKHLTADRMARVMLTACIKTPKLLQCTRESLLQAMMICSQAGLEPDGRNAHLIPFKDTVQVIFDYKGLVALAERNGVKNIYADKVCENDVFKAWVEDGVKKLNHEIDFRKPRGTPYAYYASCRRSDMLDYEVMTKDEVDAIRKRSRASGDGPWVSDYDEMAKKTVLRRMSKRWDLSSEVAEIINDDDDTPMDINRAKRPAFGEDPFGALPEAQVTSETPSNVTQLPTEADKSKQPENKSDKSDDGDLGPQKGKTAPKEEKAKETPPPQNVEVPGGALKLSLELVGFKRIDGEDDNTAWDRMVKLARNLFAASGVTEEQVLKWAQENKVAKSGQVLNDLAATKFVMLGKSWATILPEIRKK